MHPPAWRSMNLLAGIEREAVVDDGRIVVWLPGPCEGKARWWERVGNVAGAPVSEREGLCATPATLIRARQQPRGLLGKALSWWRQSAGAAEWLLPNGAKAEQVGERVTDVLLAWTEDSEPLQESRVRERWPTAQRIQRLGSHLFLVTGVQLAAAPPPPKLPPGTPVEQAAYLVDWARKSGDRRREATALTDLGVALLRANEPTKAVAVLHDALAIARDQQDLQTESDVLGNLGLAHVALKDAGRALECFQRQLDLTRDTGDHYEEKMAQTNLGHLYAALRDHANALAAYDQALALAEALADENHQAELFWAQAIQYAELGRSAEVETLGRQAIALFTKLGNPQVHQLVEALEKFRQDAAQVPSLAGFDPQTGQPLGLLFGSWNVGTVAATPIPAATPPSAPSLMRMAYTAVTSLAKFVGAGMTTVAPAVQHKRLQTCAVCEHHTGLRCKLCGCFTHLKSLMPHERCPIAKWPA
ncbi:MAG: tetratricopeptide repeat protein [Gemmataceae bacterium]|nr:tetratricopeptide repeat protein [Gemmataceae bacterium]